MNELWRYYMAPDGGGDGGAGAPSGGAAGTEGSAGTEAESKKTPAYFSQFSPDKRGSEDYAKYLGDKATITDVADAYIEAAKRAEALEKRQGNALEIPGEDSTPEQKRAFLTRLGIPESSDEYEFDNEDMKKALAPQFHKLGLTKQQGKGMVAMLNDIGKVGQQITDAARKARIDNFDSRLDAALIDKYPNKTERESHAKEAMALFQRSINRTGLGQTYEKSGLLYDEQFVLKVAEDERGRGGSGFQQGANPPAAQNGRFGSYSSDFENYIKSR